MVAMKDGVKLATDIYLPPGKGPFPVVLARSPYSRQQGQAVAAPLLEHGYAFVLQATRGRFGSEGDNLPFAADGWFDAHQDGYDAVEWIARQPWCDGEIGTWGPSALGITQLMMAGTAPPHLDAQYIVVATPDQYDLVYRGGAFRFALVDAWLQVSQFDKKAEGLWTAHPNKDAYWNDRALSARWNQVNTPALHIGGWYDLFTQGTLDAFTGAQTKGGPGARGKQQLIMGPWTHSVSDVKVGDWRFPKDAAFAPSPWGNQGRWLDHWLKGADNGAEKDPAVVYYVMGDPNDPSAPGKEWRTADRWPIPAHDTPLYLTAEKALAEAVPSSADAQPFTYGYDPHNPVPTVGGNHLMLPAGAFEQKKVEARPDVLVFTSAPLTRPLEVTGRITANLWISSDAPDTDFTVKLCDVDAKGNSFNLCDGIQRARFRESLSQPKPLEPGKRVSLSVDLWSTSYIFPKGHCIRAQVSSSNFPAYDPNPNTGVPFGKDKKQRTARNTLYVDGKRSSRLTLPVVGDAPAFAAP